MIHVTFTDAARCRCDVRLPGEALVVSCVRGMDGTWLPLSWGADGEQHDLPDCFTLNAETTAAITAAEGEPS